MKPSLLVLTAIAPDFLPEIRERFDIVYAPPPDLRRTAFSQDISRFRVVVTNGASGLTADEMDAMPALELVCCMGVGYDSIDIEAARARDVIVCNGANTNDDCVADHAAAMLFAIVRDLRELDRLARLGKVRLNTTIKPSLAGKRLGILGLGSIGEKVARRASGFDMAIGYHNRRSKQGSTYTYFDSPLALAAWADFIVVAIPGGADTRHVVDARFLAALGPAGFIVNVARGSVLDTAALIQALASKQLGGAALDVFEGEPMPPAALLEFPNVILTPHVAGWSPESIKAMIDSVIGNVTRHFAGQPVYTRV